MRSIAFQDEELKPVGYIYLTENLINGICYIGKRQKSKFDKRYLGSGMVLSKAIKKYGRKNFICTPIEGCYTIDELCEREVYGINHCSANTCEYFYNITPGGAGGGSMKGKHHSEETKHKISKSEKGKIVSDETRELQSKIHKKLSKFDNRLSNLGSGFSNYKHTEEEILKISNSNKKYYASLSENDKLIKAKNHSIKMKELYKSNKIKIGNKGLKMSNDFRLKISNITKGKKGYNNGINSIFIHPEEGVPEGYREGRIKNKEAL